MQERYTNRKKYFQEQTLVVERYIIPYLQEFYNDISGISVLEIGCGEGGNLKPFLDLGCMITGVDIAENKIENAQEYFKNHPNLTRAKFIVENIYNLDKEDIGSFDLILMRDTIEHIPNQKMFLGKLKQFMNNNAKVFFAFPPWRMPFGGHQQICKSKLLRVLPYFHLFPMQVYKKFLKTFGESDETIETLTEIKDTGISINTFKRFITANDLVIEKENYYFINPGYEIKFNLKPRNVIKLFNLPYIRDFYTTAYYCVVNLSK